MFEVSIKGFKTEAQAQAFIDEFETPELTWSKRENNTPESLYSCEWIDLAGITRVDAPQVDVSRTRINGSYPVRFDPRSISMGCSTDTNLG